MNTDRQLGMDRVDRGQRRIARHRGWLRILVHFCALALVCVLSKGAAAQSSRPGTAPYFKSEVVWDPPPFAPELVGTGCNEPDSGPWRPAFAQPGKAGANCKPQPLKRPERPMVRLSVDTRGLTLIRAEDKFRLSLMENGHSVSQVVAPGIGYYRNVYWLPNEPAGATLSLHMAMEPGSASPMAHYAVGVSCQNRIVTGRPLDNITALGIPFELTYGDRLHCDIIIKPQPPSLSVGVRSLGGTGRFVFHATGNAQEISRGGDYSVTTSQADVHAMGREVSLATVGAPVEVVQDVPHAWGILHASCIDANALPSENGSAPFGVLAGNTLAIDGAYVRSASAIQCTFTSTFLGNGMTGKVFVDTGMDGGIAHDGRQNGAEPGYSGVRLDLTDCSRITYASAVTRADGTYTLDLSRLTPGQTACVSQHVPAGYAGVSQGAGNNVVVSAARAEQVQFVYQTPRNLQGVNFGVAPLSTLQGGGAQTVAPGLAAHFAYIYTAGSAARIAPGTLPGMVNASQPWAQALYLDPQCSGTWGTSSILWQQPIDVAEGQQICIVLRVHYNGSSAHQAQHRAEWLIEETWHVPTVQVAGRKRQLTAYATCTLMQNTISLHKEWRTVPQCPATAAMSLADTRPFSTTGLARPGEWIEYRLTYSNHTKDAVSTIQLFDTVPGYTLFERAHCLHTPLRGIAGCRVERQPSPGAASGDIAWVLADSPERGGLQPQDSGTVGYCLRLAP